MKRLTPGVGKAQGLRQLKSAGIAVPPFQFFDEALPDFTPPEDLSISEQALWMRQKIQDRPWSPPSSKEVARLWKKISGGGKNKVAVRSSAQGEDSVEHSFAGQMDTILGIGNLEDVYLAIRQCQASLFTDRAVSYRKQRDLNPWQGQITVIIQTMVTARAAGVVFTDNWVPGHEGQILISSVWGLGEGLVSGQLSADQFFTTSKGQLKHQDIANKTQAITQQPDGGTLLSSVDLDLQQQPSLTTAQIKTIAKQSHRLKKLYGCDLDLEFAVQDKRVFFLQVRPVTSLGQTMDFPRIWDNANITESYPGITSPLTFTFIQLAYEKVYRQFCQATGVKQSVIDANGPLFTQMLGLLKGRVYYNLLHWYQVVAFLPGFSFNKAFLEQMMGLQKVAHFIKPSPPLSAFKRWVVEFPRLVKNALGLFFKLVYLKKQVKRFFTNFYHLYNGWKKKDWTQLSVAELVETRRLLETEILQNWKAPILNDLKCMIFFGALRQLCTKHFGDEYVANLLVAGREDIKSRQAVTALTRLIELARGQTQINQLILATPPAQAWTQLQKDFPDFAAACQRYLDDFGVRCVEEMKLETIPLKDNPPYLCALIAGGLRCAPPAPSNSQGRIEAEEKLRKVKGLSGLVLRFVSRQAEEAVTDRENQRFCRSEIYAVVRDLCLEVGRRLEKSGHLPNHRDVLYLEFEETWGALTGRLSCDALADLVNLRREKFKQYADIELPNHIETQGGVYASLEEQIPQFTAPAPMAELKGTSTGPGVIEGIALVLLTPDVDTVLQGEILVAPYTDPGWALLFPSISGLIVERGSLLSHSAIIAREMQLPALVGVEGATRQIKSGDRIRLDGRLGQVLILERAP